MAVGWTQWTGWLHRRTLVRVRTSVVKRGYLILYNMELAPIASYAK